MKLGTYIKFQFLLFKGRLGNTILKVFPKVKEKLNMESMVLFCHACHELEICDPTVWDARNIQKLLNEDVIQQALEMDKEFGALKFFIKWFGIGYFDIGMVKNCITIYGIAKNMLEELNPGLKITQMKVARQFLPKRLKEKK